ncbi:MAG: HIT domain-containing protein [Candidatus Uhrbacteria bacterium]|nr:HIT domain-containing protein [Candidatus Uhrbacteria bacterium]
MSCIFCKIVTREAKASKVYEDDMILAFMDIHPVREGQVLVIPKGHTDHFSDLDDNVATQIFLQAQRISRTIKKVLSPERVGLVVHGYGVPHAHMVVVPQNDENDITSGRMSTIENGEVVFTMKNLPLVSHEELERVAEMLR